MSTPAALATNGTISRCTRAEYDAIPALNFSAFKEFVKSPAHYKAYLSQSRVATPAMEFGSAFHCALLEPEKFLSDYPVPPKWDVGPKGGITKVGTEQKEAWERKHGPALDTEDRNLIGQMVYAIRSHPTAGALLRRAERTEIACTWRDSFGLDRKSLLDAVAFLNTDQTTIYDLKTTQDASPAEFARSIGKYRYHWQAAYYSEALAAVGYRPKHFCFVAVEKTAPYGVAVYRLGNDSLKAAAAQMRPLLRKFAECQQSDKWPGYGDYVQDIEAPAWATNHDNSETGDDEL